MKHTLSMYGQANKNPALVPPMNRATDKGKELGRQEISYAKATMGKRTAVLGGTNHSLVQLQKEKNNRGRVTENGRGTIPERGGGNLPHVASIEREVQGVLFGLKEVFGSLTKAIEVLTAELDLVSDLGLKWAGKRSGSELLKLKGHGLNLKPDKGKAK